MLACSLISTDMVKITPLFSPLTKICFLCLAMSGSPRVECDAPDCPIELNHCSCVGITEEFQADEERFCDECKEKFNHAV